MNKEIPLHRCAWASHEALMQTYHDQEWGVPLHEDQKLFEFLLLDAAQAGLSWSIVLKKRENFRRALDQFDAEKIARYDADKIALLLRDSGIIRNKLKIQSFVNNARAYLKVKEEFPSFDRYIWQFVDGKPIQNSWRTMQEIPTRSKSKEKAISLISSSTTVISTSSGVSEARMCRLN